MSSLMQGASALGQGIRRKRVGAAYRDAYMGDPQAMQELAGQDPQLARQLQNDIQKRKDDAAQRGLNKQAAMTKRRTAFLGEAKDVIENIGAFSSFEEAKEYGQREKSRLIKDYPEVSKMEGFNPEFTEQDYNESRSIAGEGGATGAYEGTGMPAQVSNDLVRGASDPEFRKTAQYARSWDIANKPDIIDTEEGRIPLYPKIDPMFKAPGDTKPAKQEIKEIKEASTNDSRVIKGTEKNKTTADEKVSLGYYNRMLGAEENIKGLGQFDSASVWERFKGMTNITASPELQQYRQAADDWIRAKLRRESGAVIADSEMSKEYEIYFPRIGDSQDVIDQKKRAREEAENSMRTASGRAYKKGARNEASAPVLNETDRSVTVDGEKHIFPTIEQYNAYKAAAGL